MGDIPNWCSTRGALLPEDVPELVWGFLDFLSATGRLAEGSDPLERLREPLMCYGGLDGGGRPRPANQPASFPCECYLPVAPTSDPAASWWRTADGEVMEMHRPRPDEPELFAWWGALVRFAQLVHEEQIPWPVMIGEFSLVGHVVQALGRDVWVYVHTRSKREVFVDSDGQAYRRHPDRRTKAGARFVACSPRADAEASGRGVASSLIADGHPRQACPRPSGGIMTYTSAQVSSAIAAMEKYRSGDTGEVGAALAVVGLCAERAAKEAHIRDDMIRMAHRSGASLRQLAEVSGLDRKTVTVIVGTSVRPQD